MSLCKTIDTLSMAYLDDELAAEERHELEAHLTECASCRATLEQERMDRSMIRRALAAPAAPDMLRARLSRAFDEQDREETKQQRRRWTSYLLPSSAIAAAAAAIAMFVAVQTPDAPQKVTNVAHDVAKVAGQRELPLEVQGPGTRPWLKQHFASDVALPQFGGEESTQLLGARLLPNGIDGHDAVLMRFQVRVPDRAPFLLEVHAVHDLKGDEMPAGTAVRINNRTLYVLEQSGRAVVSYVAPNRVAFMFVAPELTVNELVGLVGRANLVVGQ
jgi:anti-sigma factor RsiW